MRVAIIGGGSSAHLLAVLLSGSGHCVRILTSRPAEWSSRLLLQVQDEYMEGAVELCSNDPDVVLKGAQVAFLCMPVHQYGSALKKIMPALVGNGCIVGAMYGQGGFDWMVRAEARRIGVSVPRYFMLGLLPWIVRTVEYGHKAIYYGSNVINAIATSNIRDYEFLQMNILDDLGYNQWGRGKFERVPNFITLTLTVDNQIIHPSRCHALMTSRKEWREQQDIPLFYRDWDDESSALLSGVDADYSLVRAKLFGLVPSLRNKYDFSWLALQEWAYQEIVTGIRSFFVEAESLRCIRTPIVWGRDGLYGLDVNHRFFKDDFAYGLEICEWFAKMLKCDVPYVSRLMEWYRREIRPLQRVEISSGTPSAYGMTLEDAII